MTSLESCPKLETLTEPFWACSLGFPSLPNVTGCTPKRAFPCSDMMHHFIEAIERSKSKAEARLVLLALADNTDQEGYFQPAECKVARFANISEADVEKHLQTLTRLGEIKPTDGWHPHWGEVGGLYKFNIPTPLRRTEVAR